MSFSCIYAKVISSIISFIYIFEFHCFCAILFSESKILCSCAILFSEGMIKIRKGFFPTLFSIWKFSGKKSCAESGKQIYIKVTQRQKIQARGNKTIASTKTNKNSTAKIKCKKTKSLYVMAIWPLPFSQVFGWIFQSNFL